MKAKKIRRSDVKDILISSLPSRPTAPKAMGGKGYGAREMKEAFDKLPLYIIERYNALLCDVEDVGEDSLAAAMPTGIKEEHTLSELFSDITDGVLATYLCVLGKSLHEHLCDIYGELEGLKVAIGREETEGLDK